MKPLDSGLVSSSSLGGLALDFAWLVVVIIVMLGVRMSETARETEKCLAFFTFKLDGTFFLGFPDIDELHH